MLQQEGRAAATTMKQTFDEYLRDQFLRDNPETTKDVFEDAFEAWVERLEKSDVINYAARALHEQL